MASPAASSGGFSPSAASTSSTPAHTHTRTYTQTPGGPSAAQSALDMHAIPFVTVDEDDKFHVNEEAVTYLRSLQGKIAAVSIAGIYRTGKSYLLNQIMGKSNGFTVGPTVKACTKGIWLWGKAIEVDGSDVHVLFMDTEGLGSTVRSESYDCRIFALALLLSSYFIYNSFGTIDGNAISKLSLVVNLTKHIHVRSQSGREDSGTEYNQFFPNFLWVVRDFTVKLEKDGRKISAREYLEDALKPEEGVSEATEQKNAVRMLIRNFFPERDAVTMVRPVADEKQLMNLAGIPAEGLRPEFRAQVDALRKRIFSSVRPKTLYGKPLNGAMLASLAQAYVAALNTGNTPTISTAWDRVVDSQCADAVEGATRTYVDSMQGLLVRAQKDAHRHTSSMSSLPDAAPLFPQRTLNGYAAEGTIVEEEDMHAAHAQSSQAAFRYFQTNAVQDADKTPPFEVQLRSSLEQEHSRFRRANEAASAAYCLEMLDRLHLDASRRLQALKARRTSAARTPASSNEGAAARGEPSGGRGDMGGASKVIADAAESVLSASTVAKEYRAACEALNATFMEQARGPAKHRVLNEYMLNKLPLLMVDACMSSDESYSAYSGALNARISDLVQQLSVARGNEKAAQELLAQEKKSYESALSEASRRAAEEAERLKADLASRQAEMERLQTRFDKVLATSEAHNVRSDEAIAKLTADLAAASARIDELQTARITALFDLTVASQRLADSEAARGEAERLLADVKLKLTDEAKSAALLLERCRSAENETVRLREQTELLYESIRVQKDLLAAKNDEKEECEYQWGVAKAKLAQTESDHAALQADLNVMTSVATQLKTLLIKSSKGGVVKGLVLDRLESRAYESLGAPGAV